MECARAISEQLVFVHALLALLCWHRRRRPSLVATLREVEFTTLCDDGESIWMKSERSTLLNAIKHLLLIELNYMDGLIILHLALPFVRSVGFSRRR